MFRLVFVAPGNEFKKVIEMIPSTHRTFLSMPHPHVLDRPANTLYLVAWKDMSIEISPVLTDSDVVQTKAWEGAV